MKTKRKDLTRMAPGSPLDGPSIIFGWPRMTPRMVMIMMTMIMMVMMVVMMMKMMMNDYDDA
eukprot:10685241-Karenia_brevis.AAC.1